MPFKDKLNRTCGFLDIDEQDKRKKFLRRYFILNKSKGLLEWYMDSPAVMGDSAQPCGIINLDYITKVDEAKRSKLDYCFVINTPFRPYYVQASNQSDVEEWVEILNDASKITVPPEVLQHLSCNANTESVPTESVDVQDNSSWSGDGSIDANDQNFTYRTEIVGNVVVKKKLQEQKRPEEPISPSNNSTGSETKFPLLTPDNTSLHVGFFSADDKDVIKKGWAVKQGHVRKNWKRRYFVLKSNGFAYYKSEHDKEPIRTVPISEILAAKEEDGDASRLRDNLLLLATTDKIYYMQADSPEDMKSWITALNNSINANRVASQKNQVPYSKTKPSLTIRGDAPNIRIGGKSPLLKSPHSQSTSNLIPIVPVLHPISTQVTYHEGYGLGRSADLLDDSHSAALVQSRADRLKKRSSAQSIAYIGSQDSIGHSTCSNDSLEQVHTEPANQRLKKVRKTHRRADSEITVLPTHTVESVMSSIHKGKHVAGSIAYNEEDIRSRPESLNLSALAEHLPKDISTKQDATNRRTSSGNYVTSHLDPQVDLRSAVKPSSVKKKKNTGILFSLNTMLNRKQDKIRKDKSTYKK